VRLATRGSPLALAQADIVAGMLATRFVGIEVERVVVHTEGDRRTDDALDRIGGQGVFVKEIQHAVGDGRADVAVHSAKDLPPIEPPGLAVVAVPVRADARDALVGSTLDALPPGAVVATGSPRRRAQLAHLRPDLVFVGLRGNMGTRLEHVRSGQVDVVVVAAAALDRLGWADRLDERLDTSTCLPQVGQGALALECRVDDRAVRSLLGTLDDQAAHMAVTAERAFLRALGAGCTLPVAAHATVVRGAGGGAGAGRVRLEGLIASGDGRVVVRDVLEGGDPERLGAALAALLVDEQGAAAIEGWEVTG
jgi:hydroxymethylbilane synthase